MMSHCTVALLVLGSQRDGGRGRGGEEEEEREGGRTALAHSHDCEDFMSAVNLSSGRQFQNQTFV